MRGSTQQYNKFAGTGYSRATRSQIPGGEFQYEAGASGKTKAQLVSEKYKDLEHLRAKNKKLK